MSQNKLKHRVIFCSSEDAGYSAKELNNSSADSKGWLSARFPEFPQEIGFELLGSNPQERNLQLTQVQILSHQSKIATKIEIFVGVGNDYQSANYKRLGFLSLDTNQRSSYQARELKTVYVDQLGNFLKFRIQKNYMNDQNPFNQVGLMAVNFFGDVSTGGNPSAGPGSSAPKSNNVFGVEVKLDSSTMAKLKLIADAKSKAIESEDYVTAKAIKSIEVDMKALTTKLAEIDLSKKNAVAAEDYDLARDLKEQGDLLRDDISSKIMALKIPGVAFNNPIPANANMRPMSASNRAPVGMPDVKNYSGYPSSESKNYHDEKPVGGGTARRGDFEAMNAHDDLPVGRGRRSSEVRVGPENGNEYDEPNEYGADDFDPDSRPNSKSNRARPSNEFSPADRTHREHDPVAVQDDAHAGGDDEMDPGAGYGNKKPSQQFPPGEHPLEGVAGLDFSNIPDPDPFTIKAKSLCEQSGVLNLLGDYCSRCLFSKSWVLRDAAISKTHMMLIDIMKSPGDSDPVSLLASILPAIIAVCRTGVEDKNSQVNFGAFDLLDEAIAHMNKCKITRSAALNALDAVTFLQLLIEKLADGNQRVREGTRKSLIALSSTPSVGCAPIVAKTLVSLNAKQKIAWRPLQSRLVLLADLVSQHGLGGSSGLALENLMNYMKSSGAYTHSNVEVRDAAKELTVAIQKQVGTPALQPYLEDCLRPKQREEYLNAFDGGVGATAAVSSSPRATSPTPTKKASTKTPAAASSGAAKSSQPQKGPQNSDKLTNLRGSQNGPIKGGHSIGKHNPPGSAGSNNRYSKSDKYDDDFDGEEDSSAGPKGNRRSSAGPTGGDDHPSLRASHKHSEDKHGAANDDATASLHICQFCGDGDGRSWTEDKLDMHYLSDCPYLAPCPACQQILEIASLPDHLLDECKYKEQYVPCDVTGLAIKVTELTAWQRSPSCVSPPDNCFYCPMCLSAVEDDTEPWRTHLLKKCPQNLRTKQR